MTTLTLSSPPGTTTGPRPVRWTCTEFHRVGDTGLFEGRRAMLIDGVILEEGAMNPPHALTLEVVMDTIRAVFATGWRVRGQSPLVLGQDLDPLPDVAVIAGTTRGTFGHPTTADLVIEVADSSLDFETTEKRLLYARAGIREYWVVDINGRRLLVYRDPQGGDYAIQLALAATDSVSPLAVPTAAVRVADLLV